MSFNDAVEVNFHFYRETRPQNAIKVRYQLRASVISILNLFFCVVVEIPHVAKKKTRCDLWKSNGGKKIN